MTGAQPPGEPSEKLQKVLANLGHGSRREVEEWIRAGRVSVDGQVATVGTRVGAGQGIRVDGREVERRRLGRRVILYHKPAGEEVSRAPAEGTPSAFGPLPDPGSGKWVNVGRLDTDTEGLLLFTNDGEFAHLVTHPSGGMERRYRARVDGTVPLRALERVNKGLAVVGDRPLRDVRLAPEREPRGRNAWYSVALREGRNRVVRRLFESLGLSVSRLIRVGYGPVDLPPDLGRGEWAELPSGVAGKLEREARKARKAAAAGRRKGGPEPGRSPGRGGGGLSRS